MTNTKALPCTNIRTCLQQILPVGQAKAQALFFAISRRPLSDRLQLTCRHATTLAESTWLRATFTFPSSPNNNK